MCYDAMAWDISHKLGWMGAAIGVAIGAGITCFRRIVLQVICSTLLGFALVAGAAMVDRWGDTRWDEEDRIEGVWNLCRDGDNVNGSPRAWGLYIGAPSAGFLCAGLGIVTRWRTRRSIWSIAVPSFIALSLLAQSFFWQSLKVWEYHDFHVHCGNVLDIFAAHGVCPNCSTRWDQVRCVFCGLVRPFDQWVGASLQTPEPIEARVWTALDNPYLVSFANCKA